MDRDAALAIVGYLAGNFPALSTSAQQGAVWCDHLRDVPEEDGKLVADALVARERGPRDFPTVGEFRAVWRGLRRRAPEQPALDVPPRSDEQRSSALANLRKLREQLRSATALPVDLRATPEAEARAVARRPVESAGLPEFCNLDDHSHCGSGPVRVPKDGET